MKILFAALALYTVSATSLAYPLFGSDDRGIGRLVEARLAHEGVIEGKKKVSGELLTLEQTDLRLLNQRDLSLPDINARFTTQITNLLGEEIDRYGVSVLDLTDLQNPRYAEINGNKKSNPGSVGKLVVVTAMFQALADVYPDDLDARLQVLKSTVITADEFIIKDSHTVRFWNPDTQTLTRRPLEVGDKGSLWEFLDWMMSASSNAAASTVMKQAMLLVHYGTAYPVDDRSATAFFADTPKENLRDLAVRTFQEPLTRSGVDVEFFRQGSFFTHTGKARVPGTSSYATSREMMNFLLRLEQGLIVDEFSSREIKRLLYMTERRIRYASSPALRDSAVYFKSGSLFRCEPEEGFVCKKYQGNKENLMNSVAIVESPAAAPRLFYMVTLMSNVLRKNSAVEHQTLATRIHEIIAAAHPVAEVQSSAMAVEPAE